MGIRDSHIAEYAGYKEQAGKHDVIYIDFSEMPRECQNYQEYIEDVYKRQEM